jgi:hypothetical protein
MRTITIGDGKALRVDPERRAALKSTLELKHKRAFDNRFVTENIWRGALRGYQGQQPEGERWKPFEAAPVLEITEAASACDTVLSQAEDLIFQLKPPVLARSRKAQFDDVGDALQELVDYGIESNSWNWEAGIKEGLIDCVQLGTQILYVPWTKTIRKTNVQKVETFGPKIYCIAPEDFIIPANATKDMQAAEFCTMRLYLSRDELNLRARLNSWHIDDAAAADYQSTVRRDRMRAGGLWQEQPTENPPLMIGDTFIYFDIDGDGIEEDLEVIWNMTSNGIFKIMYNRYDRRPFILECYQDRAHLAYGVGCMEMGLPYQQVESEIWNNAVWNLEISNTKMYQMPEALMNESEEIYPGKRWANDDGEIKPIDMGEVNPSAFQASQMIAAKMQARIGIQSLNAPLKAGNRTPATSMLSLLQQANRRFTHPFNNMRNASSGATEQCLYRYQERVRMGDKQVIEKLEQILGEEKAQLVIKLFKSDEVELTDAIDVELKAASVSVNRETDRQSMLALITQVLPLYWGAKKELAQFIATPPFPGADKIAKEADVVLDKLFTKVMKTFDQISDPRTVTISLQELQPMAQGVDQAMAQLAGGGQPQQSQNGGPPQTQAPSPQGPPANTIIQ